MSGELTKLKIEAYQEADYSDTPSNDYIFEVMFNPTNYVRKYEVEYEDRQGAGDTASPQVRKASNPSLKLPPDTRNIAETT